MRNAEVNAADILGLAINNTAEGTPAARCMYGGRIYSKKSEERRTNIMMSFAAMKFFYIFVYVWFVIGALIIAVPAMKEFINTIFGKKK